MNRYRFRLEKVLDVRRVQEGQAAAAVAVASRAHAEREAELLARQVRYAQLAPAAGMLEADAFDRARLEAELAARSVAHGFALEHEATVLVAERVAERAHANRRVTALERLDERGRDEHWQESLRAEVAIADEQTVSRRHRGRA